MSVRLRAQRTRWSVGESPRFMLDFRNQGRRSFRVFQSPVSGAFLVDGYSFAWSLGRVGGAFSPLPPGRTYRKAFRVTRSAKGLDTGAAQSDV